MSTILPARHQPPLPLDRLILNQVPGAEAIEMDVLIVGAGPAGLSCAIELARLAKHDQASGGDSRRPLTRGDRRGPQVLASPPTE